MENQVDDYENGYIKFSNSFYPRGGKSQKKKANGILIDFFIVKRATRGYTFIAQVLIEETNEIVDMTFCQHGYNFYLPEINFKIN